jgi:deazaflavin-dependent oxidoreductase (nitroreductase family)
MNEDLKYFRRPNSIERVMNKTLGVLARWGLGPSYMHLLRVTGVKTGKVYSTPVNLMEFRGRLYLVGTRGHTGWSRNALSGGNVTLVRGSKTKRYRALPVQNDHKLEVLKAYLDEYTATVQRFFAVRSGSPPEAFRATAPRHPVFELLPD